MKLYKLILPAMLVSAVAATAMVRGMSFFESPDPEAVRKSPVALLCAQPFTLEEPVAYAWRADHPEVKAGYLIVASISPELLPVRQTHNALMFANDLPVERINGEGEARVFVGMLPSTVGKNGELELDLSSTVLYMGYPAVLPESLTPEQAEAEFEQALAVGAGLQTRSSVQNALKAGGPSVALGTYGELRRHAADLIEHYSPDERDLVSGLRAPLLQK